MQQQQMAAEQQTAMMKTPMMDPTKNPELAAGLMAQAEQQQQ